MTKIIVLLTTCLFISGCARDFANRYYSDVRYPPRDASTVEFLSRKPERPFTIIADFQSRGETAQDMRQKAATIGADAVIVSYLGGDYDLSEQWAGNDVMGHTYNHIVGTAIHYN